MPPCPAGVKTFLKGRIRRSAILAFAGVRAAQLAVHQEPVRVMAGIGMGLKRAECAAEDRADSE